MKRHLSDTTRFAAVAAALLAIGALVSTPALAGGAKPSGRGHGTEGNGHKEDDGVCKQVAQDTLRSCRNGVRDEYWLAIARCENASATDMARHSDSGSDFCDRTAREDLKMQQQDCTDQRDARNDVCDQLGGGSYNPKIDPGDFADAIDNRYLPLVPGTTFHYRAQTAAGVELDDVEVTHETRSILGVPCTVVHDTVTLGGDLTEDTIDWYAQDKAGNVWYFGEEAKQYADGILVGIDGSWMAGVDGALPGIVMEANPAIGDVYRQEFAIGEAEDMGQVQALGQSVSVPYGSFTNALETKEFSALEPGTTENKYYVPTVGFVQAVDPATGEHQDLVSITN
jgi:hypothetical protein